LDAISNPGVAATVLLAGFIGVMTWVWWPAGFLSARRRTSNSPTPELRECADRNATGEWFDTSRDNRFWGR